MTYELRKPRNLHKEISDKMKSKGYELLSISDYTHTYKHKDRGNIKVCTVNDQASLTDQSHKDECDTNCIMSRYLKTGELNSIARHPGEFRDISGVADLHAQMSHNSATRMQTFNRLPKHILQQFQSPEELISFMDDPSNAEELISLGLKPSDKQTDTSMDGLKQDVSAVTNDEGGGSDSTQSKPNTTSKESYSDS